MPFHRICAFAFFIMVWVSCSQPVDRWERARQELNRQDFLGCIIELNLLMDGQMPSDSALLMRAYCYNRVGKHDKAEADLLHVLRINPGNLGARLEYGRLMAYRGDTLGALKMLTIPGDKAEKQILSDFLLERARLLFFTRRFSESLINLNQAIEADSTNAEAWFLRGGFYSSTLVYPQAQFFKPAQAILDFQKAIQHKPDYAEAYFKLANTEMDNFGEMYSGMIHLSKAIQLDPYLSDYYVERAKRHISLGSTSAAVKDLQTALHLNPLDTASRAVLRELGIKKEAP